VTNIPMGMEIDAVNEFENVPDLDPAKTLVDA
jgi:glyoxylate carboligase